MKDGLELLGGIAIGLSFVCAYGFVEGASSIAERFLASIGVTNPHAATGGLVPLLLGVGLIMILQREEK
jgi:hypothetical protein